MTHTPTNQSVDQLADQAIDQLMAVAQQPTPASDLPVVQLRGRRWKLPAAVVALSLSVGIGLVALNQAHKSVYLDVDGTVTRINTFAGSVDSLLERQGLHLSEHDVVVPDPDTRLRDGAKVVVRYGRQVTLARGGETEEMWIAALDAGEVLQRLAVRGGDVALVASRSGDRAAIPLRLAAGGTTVALVADGLTEVLPHDGQDVDALLAAAGIELGEHDRVTIRADHPAAPLAIVVERIEYLTDYQVSPIPYPTREVRDSNRFRDLDPLVTKLGVDGQHTRIDRVTLIDGLENRRELIFDDITLVPTPQILAVGTRERPRAVNLPEGHVAPSDDIWRALAQCESGGRPNVISPGGRFHGLYQFSVATWNSVGGTGLPSEASPEEQRQRAVYLQARSGWGQWPACARRLGLIP